jgi:hypothetical protein
LIGKEDQVGASSIKHCSLLLRWCTNGEIGPIKQAAWRVACFDLDNSIIVALAYERRGVARLLFELDWYNCRIMAFMEV